MLKSSKEFSVMFIGVFSHVCRSFQSCLYIFIEIKKLMHCFTRRGKTEEDRKERKKERKARR